MVAEHLLEFSKMGTGATLFGRLRLRAAGVMPGGKGGGARGCVSEGRAAE